MGTWRNDSDVTRRISNISGEAVNVPPGGSVKTYQDLTANSDWTLVSASPVWSPSFGWDVAMIGPAGGTETVTMGKRVSGLEIYNRSTSSGEVDIHFNDVSGPKAALLRPGRSVEFTKAEVWGRVNSVIVESSFGAVVEIRSKQE